MQQRHRTAAVFGIKRYDPIFWVTGPVPNSALSHLVCSAVVLLAGALAWSALRELFIEDEVLRKMFPGIGTLATTLTDLTFGGPYFLLGDKLLLDHFSASALRVFPGLIAGSVLGYYAGMACAVHFLSATIARAVLPLLFATSRLSILLILMTIFGILEFPKVLVSGWIGFLFLATASFSNAVAMLYGNEKGADAILPEYVAAYRFSRMQLLRHVLLPALRPHFFVGLEMAASSSWTLLVFSESMTTDVGLGYLIFRSFATNQWSLLFLATILLSICNLATWGIIRFFRKILLSRVA